MGDYSGGRGGWRGDGVTPYQGLKKAFEGAAQVELNRNGQNVGALARACDVLIFFPTITEEEGSDRSSFKMPSAHESRNREETDKSDSRDPVATFLHGFTQADFVGL